MTCCDECDPDDPKKDDAKKRAMRLLDVLESEMSDLDRKRFHVWLLAPVDSQTTEESALPDRPARRIQLIPGSRLTAAARFLLPPVLFERYVRPPISDMQQEYIDALAAGHVWHARWIAFRGHLLVIPGWGYAFLAGKLHGLFGRGN